MAQHGLHRQVEGMAAGGSGVSPLATRRRLVALADEAALGEKAVGRGGQHGGLGEFITGSLLAAADQVLSTDRAGSG